jgi:predicted ATP-grasp superfamily ATP-dependent carboligase
MVIVCDCQYRSAINAIRQFAFEGETVIAVTTDNHKSPPAFYSAYVSRCVTLPSDENQYANALISLCREYDNPILFPTGNFTLTAISNRLDEFSRHSRFCVSPPEMLSSLNDKKWVKEAAQKFGIKVPKQYSIDTVEKFPVVVKPFCGEKFSLKAQDRYIIAHSKDELICAYEHFRHFDDQPIIEEYIKGQGIGVSFVLNNNSKVQTYFCHKRIVEYPLSGGPSACLESFYDKRLVESTKRFFEEIGFIGCAMAEFKFDGDDYYLLEVNPRIWGSFPSTLPCKSDFIKSYIRACTDNSFISGSYLPKIKVKFLRGLIMACLSRLRRLELYKALKLLFLIINPSVKDAMFCRNDFLPTIRDFFRR